GVRVAGKGHVESLPEGDHPCHGVGRRRVHSYLTVPVQGHEAKGRVHGVIHDLEVQTVAIADGVPVGHARAAQGIHADLDRARTDGLEVHHRGKIVHIRVEVWVPLRGRRGAGSREWDPRHASKVVDDESVGLRLDPLRYVRVCGSPGGRIVLEAAEVWRRARRRAYR